MISDQTKIKDEVFLKEFLLSETYKENANLAIFAIRSLVYYYCPKVFERLAEIIENDDNPRKITEAIYVLSHQQPNERVKEMLLNKLSSTDEAVRNAAATVLKACDLPMLEDLYKLAEDPSIKIKDKIIWLLGHKGSKETLKFLEKKLQTAEKEEEKSVITDAISSLKRIHVKFLLEDLFEDARRIKEEKIEE